MAKATQLWDRLSAELAETCDSLTRNIDTYARIAPSGDLSECTIFVVVDKRYEIISSRVACSDDDVRRIKSRGYILLGEYGAEDLRDGLKTAAGRLFWRTALQQALDKWRRA